MDKEDFISRLLLLGFQQRPSFMSAATDRFTWSIHPRWRGEIAMRVYVYYDSYKLRITRSMADRSYGLHHHDKLLQEIIKEINHLTKTEKHHEQ
jgi:hypothetical protein